MAKIKAEGSADSGSKTSPPDTVTPTTNTAIYRDVAGAVAGDRDPSGIKDTRACMTPNQNDPTEDSNHCSVTETTKARRGRTAAPSSKSRRGKKAIAKESGLKPASVVESATAPENESMSGQRLPSTNARRVRRRTARAVSDKAEATPQNTNSSVAAEDLSGSRSLRRIPSRTEYSVDEVVATAALLQSAIGKLNRSTSVLPTSSEVELCPAQRSHSVAVQSCIGARPQGIGIPGIEVVIVLVGA
ncbi:hypothetical protein ACEPAH_9595 [Sanghuangporus vaninii]